MECEQNMSILTLLRPLVLRLAYRSPRVFKLYVRVYRPRGDEYNELLKRVFRVHAIGTNTHINYGAVIADPQFVSIGSNVVLSDCTIFCHDGAAEVLVKALGIPLDAVARVVIKDNVFVGWGAIIMPGVTVGPNAIVGAGAVVTEDVLPGMVVGGVPARPIGTFDGLARKMEARTKSYPWCDLIMQRGATTDDGPLAERLLAERLRFFWQGAKADINRPDS